MTIVMGLDQHREQITFDALDVASGEVSRGRIRPADREGVRRWLARWDGREIEAALEATTGWRFVVEELRAVGAEVHLAEPAETRARRGPKKRPKTDRQDAFAMFKRAHGDEREGCGIGLAVCRKIVEAHGGSIVAARAPGGGTRIRFSLPALATVPDFVPSPGP